MTYRTHAKQRIVGTLICCLFMSFSAFSGKKFILSIDGGGVRGIIPATFVNHFCKDVGKQPYELFDLIAGTSIGGILTLGYGAKVNTQLLEDLFFKKATTIFPQLSAQTLLGVGGATGPKYGAQGIESVLQEFFQGKTLADSAVPVMATACDIERYQPYLFKSWVAQQDSTQNVPMWEAGRATSAAPTYFPPKLIQNGTTRLALVDGGLCLNNPTMAAFAEGKKMWPQDEIIILSLGTGETTVSYPYDQAKLWGAPLWIQPALNMTMDLTAKAVDYQARQLLDPKSYYRFEPHIDSKDQPMDEPSQGHLTRLQTNSLDLYGQFSHQISDLKDLLTAGGKL